MIEDSASHSDAWNKAKFSRRYATEIDRPFSPALKRGLTSNQRYASKTLNQTHLKFVRLCYNMSSWSAIGVGQILRIVVGT